MEGRKGGGWGRSDGNDRLRVPRYHMWIIYYHGVCNKSPKDCVTENNKYHSFCSQGYELGRAGGRRLICAIVGSLDGAGGCASEMAHSRGHRLMLLISCKFSALASSPHGPCHLACTSVLRKRVGSKVAFYDLTSKIT